MAISNQRKAILKEMVIHDMEFQLPEEIKVWTEDCIPEEKEYAEKFFKEIYWELRKQMIKIGNRNNIK